MPPGDAALPDSADVVIIGGGVIGTSAAFHLAEAGVPVVLVERAQLGSGSTCRAAGGVRTQFSDALNIEIARRSLDAFRDFGRRPGWEIDLKPVGYLFVLSREEDLESFRHSIALQHEQGLDTRLVSPGEARRLCPLLAGDDILAGAFSPGDGHATPEAVVQGYASAARARGARIVVGCESWSLVTRLRRDGRCGAPGDATATPDPVHRGDRWAAGHPPDDDRLRVELLLSPRGSGTAHGHVGSERDTRIQSGDHR
jgi:sarcosine oxidase subunit beta